MKLLVAFLRLIRSLNLLFIAMTQVLFQHAIVETVLDKAGAPRVLSNAHFILLVVSSRLVISSMTIST